MADRQFVVIEFCGELPRGADKKYGVESENAQLRWETRSAKILHSFDSENDGKRYMDNIRRVADSENKEQMKNIQATSTPFKKRFLTTKDQSALPDNLNGALRSVADVNRKHERSISANADPSINTRVEQGSNNNNNRKRKKSDDLVTPKKQINKGEKAKTISTNQCDTTTVVQGSIGRSNRQSATNKAEVTEHTVNAQLLTQLHRFLLPQLRENLERDLNLLEEHLSVGDQINSLWSEITKEFNIGQ
ncbi:unnamed protein product, partial [Iphiclides podalirius]